MGVDEVVLIEGLKVRENRGPVKCGPQEQDGLIALQALCQTPARSQRMKLGELAGDGVVEELLRGLAAAVEELVSSRTVG
jgi:hypothetical protein